MALLTPARLRALREERLLELQELRRRGTKVVGWFSPATPVELIRAAGAVPVRLLRGGYDAETRGDRHLRSDACPLCLGAVGAFEFDPLHMVVDAVAATNTCDMLRRLPETIHRQFGVPVYQLYLPRTSEPLPHRLDEFRRQLEWFARELAAFAGRGFEPGTLAAEIGRVNRVRAALRAFDDRRESDRPAVGETDVLDLVGLATTLSDDGFMRVLDEASAAVAPPARAGTPRPRLLLAGSEVADLDRWLIGVIEQRADIVTDLLDTGTDWFAEDCPVEDDPVAGLARWYFSRPGMMRRPNDAAWALARRRVAGCRVAGVVWKTLLYCDPWNFESVRARDELRVPVLHVDGNYSSENREQVRTRVEAFLESL